MAKLKDLKLNKIVELLPHMSEDEYAMLKADIQENGIKEPLVVINNEVIDGRHRYLAAKQLKIREIPIKEIETPEEGLETYVLSLNLSRRHLNAGQRVMVILDVKKVSADTISKLAGVGIATVKRVQYIKKHGNENEIELIRSGKALVNTVQNEIKKRVNPPIQKTTVPTQKDTTSSNNTTTTKMTSEEYLQQSERFTYINKHGNDIQRAAVKNNPKAIDQIYTTITKNMEAILPPSHIPPVVPPTEDWKAKYNRLYDAHEELIDKCLALESQIMKMKGEVVQKDYTQLKGKDITVEELDEAGLAFSDHPTYVRLMKEYQDDKMKEYKKGFKD